MPQARLCFPRSCSPSVTHAAAPCAQLVPQIKRLWQKTTKLTARMKAPAKHQKGRQKKGKDGRQQSSRGGKGASGLPGVYDISRLAKPVSRSGGPDAPDPATLLADAQVAALGALAKLPRRPAFRGLRVASPRAEALFERLEQLLPQPDPLVGPIGEFHLWYSSQI